MSENTGGDQAVEHATSVGQTGGLPGDNAHWRTSRVADDELASTVQRGDVAAGGPPDEPVASGSSGSPDERLDGSLGDSLDGARRAVEEDVANGDAPEDGASPDEEPRAGD